MSLMDEWKTALPETLGLDLRSLNAAADRASHDPTSCLHSVLVARRGVLTYERYFTAPTVDQGRRGDAIAYDARTAHPIRSITKTVVALLFGIARDGGFLPDLDAPIMAFLPRYADLDTPDLRRVTIRHVLTMSAGFTWNEWRSPCDLPDSDQAVAESADPVRVLLTTPFETAPGERLIYTSLVSHLLVEALTTALGEDVAAFAERVLWAPLGIATPEWSRIRKAGPVAGGTGLSLRPRDLARIGQVILDRGQWHGRQIVSESWIEAMTHPHITVNDPVHMAPGYGYQIWIDATDIGGRKVDHFDGKGAGGQFLVIVPSLDIVFVTTAGYYGEDRQNVEPLTFLNRHVLTSVTDVGEGMADDPLAVLRRRLRFRAWHRGTREADLLLGSFADAHLGSFDDAQLSRFEALLEVADPDLYNWITGRESAPSAYDSDVLRLLTAFRIPPTP